MTKIRKLVLVLIDFWGFCLGKVKVGTKIMIISKHFDYLFFLSPY
jgi:hypothetical protein